MQRPGSASRGSRVGRGASFSSRTHTFVSYSRWDWARARSPGGLAQCLFSKHGTSGGTYHDGALGLRRK